MIDGLNITEIITILLQNKINTLIFYLKKFSTKITNPTRDYVRNAKQIEIAKANNNNL